MRYFLLIAVLFFPLKAFLQVEASGSASDEIEALINDAYKFRRSNPDSARIYAQTALDLALKHKLKKQEGSAYLALGLAERYSGKLVEAMRLQQLGAGRFPFEWGQPACRVCLH